MKFLTKEEYAIFKNKNLKDLGKNDCAFCNIKSSFQKERIIWEGKSFYIMHPLHSYLGIKNHLMVIPYKHRRYTYDMNKKEFGDFKDVEIFLKNYYGKEEYFSFIRESMGKRSMEHLHYHFLPGVIDSGLMDMLKKQGYPKI